ARLFEMTVGLGGKDWTPYTYGEHEDGAVEYNAVLDLNEMSIRDKIIREGKAYRVLICRSHQSEMVIAVGMTLIQDLQAEGYGPESVHRGPKESRVVMHMIRIKADSRIARYLMPYIERNGIKPQDGWYEVPFNSWHHQAADLKKGSVVPPLIPDSIGRAV